MRATLTRPSCYGETLPTYDWLLHSHVSMKYTALEKGLFHKQVPVLCSVFVRVYVCNMYLLENGIDIQTSMWRGMLQLSL